MHRTVRTAKAERPLICSLAVLTPEILLMLSVFFLRKPWP
jgi:hypothetical protein